MTGSNLWKYTLQAEDDSKKYLDILKRKFHFSNKLLQSLKQGQNVWVNGQFTYLTSRGKNGDTLSIDLHPWEICNIEAHPLPLDIIYEDNHILAVNKPAGQVVHPNPNYPANTLANAVAYHWQVHGESHIFRPIHRIDRNTTGVVIIAKNKFTHQQLARQLQDGIIKKHYLGFCSGIIAEKSGLLNGAIGLAHGSFIKRQVKPDGLPALTHFRVHWQYCQAALLEFELSSGRTHQIRVHCQAFGHSLLGDDLYGGDTALISRQALHSYKYELRHPLNGQKLVLQARIPDDLLVLGKILLSNPSFE
jgi:23S rRNA pseudouridine1911/1915/1917 synthase